MASKNRAEVELDQIRQSWQAAGHRSYDAGAFDFIRYPSFLRFSRPGARRAMSSHSKDTEFGGPITKSALQAKVPGQNWKSPREIPTKTLRINTPMAYTQPRPAVPVGGKNNLNPIRLSTKAKRFIPFSLCGILMGLVSAASPALADVTYSDFASWSAAVTGVTTVTVPDPSPQTFINLGTDGSVTYSGVVFSANSALGNGNFFNVGELFSGSPAVLSDQEQTSGIANILITFPEAVEGFALDYGTFSGSGVTFALSNGDSVVQGSTAAGYTTPDFVGVTDSSFTSVLVTSDDGVLDINNISYAPAAITTPEPGDWLPIALFSFGLLGYGAWRRNKRMGTLAA
jgi:hypothetical protein